MTGRRACYNLRVKKKREAHLEDPLAAAVAAAQEEHQLLALPAGGSFPLVVGVSGGADSVCLLHVLWRLAEAWRLELHVAHVDHGLRPSAGGDREFVGALAARFGLPFHPVVLDPQALRADKQGLEAAARVARYRFLAQVACEVSGSAGSGPCVAVAHHADDQAETLLLRLVQGSGLRGLGGLRPVTVVPLADGGPAVRLVRPLLGVRRTDILAYAERHALAFVEDETNADTRFVRNYLRHVVLPSLAALNPNISTTLARSAELLAAEAVRAEAEDGQTLARLLVEPPTGARVVLDLVQWQALSLAARRGVLRQALAELAPDLGAVGREVGYEHIEEIVRTASPLRSGGPHPLPAGLAWSVIGATAAQRARLCLHVAAATPLAGNQPRLTAEWRRQNASLPLPVPGEVEVGTWRLAARRVPLETLPNNWQANDDPWRLYADADQLGEPILAAPEPGMRIAPLGMDGSHRRVVDVLAGHKIPRSMRGDWPLLLDRRDRRVLWVCGLHPAAALRITAQTRTVVCLVWQRCSAAKGDG
jgi:tRNA(Ile)-lysidine synthase